MNAQHLLANLIYSTKPPKHMRARDSRGRSLSNHELAAMPKTLEIERLIEECERWGADPHAVIAQALTDEARQDSEKTGMTLLKQSDLAWKLVDKANASKKALDIDANVKGSLTIGIVRFSDLNPAPVDPQAVSTTDVDGTGAGG